MLWLADAVHTLHSAIVGFFAVGWALPWAGSWWGVVVGAPIIQLNWLLLDNRCVLTIVEDRLRGPAGPAAEDAVNEGEAFIVRLLSRLVGGPVPVWWGNALGYGVLWGSFAVSALRLAGR